MSPTQITELVLVLLTAALVTSGLGWLRHGQSVWPPVSAALLASAAVVAAVSDRIDDDRLPLTLVVVVAGLVAAVGGGPLTTRVFALVDRTEPIAVAPQRSLGQAGAVLRGGAWIGALERLAVFAGLAAGFPEGVAVVLALKGVGRYPDLRDADRGGSGTGERFIIGTFTSVLWAAACAGLVALVRR